MIVHNVDVDGRNVRVIEDMLGLGATLWHIISYHDPRTPVCDEEHIMPRIKSIDIENMSGTLQLSAAELDRCRRAAVVAAVRAYEAENALSKPVEAER